MLDPDRRRRRLRRLKRALQEAAAPENQPASNQLDPTTSTYISNPVVCKTLGSALIWENLNKDKYPIYVKDSLLNTNADFDFGEFAALPEELAKNNYDSFVFTFTQPGVYVFTDSRNKAK